MIGESNCAADFTKLQNALPAGWGTVFSDVCIMPVRTMLKWAYDDDLIDRPVTNMAATAPRHPKDKFGRSRLQRRSGGLAACSH